MIITEKDLLSWAKATVKKYEGQRFLISDEEKELDIARQVISLIKKKVELEKRIKNMKSKLSSKNREIEELRSKIAEAEFKELPNVEGPQLVISGDPKALSVLWDLIKNNGWEAYEITLNGFMGHVLRVKDEEGQSHIVILGKRSGMLVLSVDIEYFKEKTEYITPLGTFERTERKLPKAIKDALVKALAQYFELVKNDMKIELFMTNILPFVRLIGIEVGDPNRVRSFMVWHNDEAEVPIYTPEDAYRGWKDALNSKSHKGYVDGGYLKLSTLTQTLLEFMNYTIQQIATRYPEVVSEALNIAARSMGKLPTTSLVDLGGEKTLEETEEVEETD